MEIVINDNRTIEEIQNEFSAEFPYLKIEFLSTTPDKKGMASKSDLFPRQKKLSAIQDKHSEGKLSLAPERTVREIRDELKEKYGCRQKFFMASSVVSLTCAVGRKRNKMNNSL